MFSSLTLPILSSYDVDAIMTAFSSEEDVVMAIVVEDIVEDNIPRVKCRTCDHREPNEVQIGRHHKVCHPELYVHQCKNCDYVTWNKDNLRRHSKMHRSMSYECMVCGNEYDNRTTLYKHLMMMH